MNGGGKIGDDPPGKLSEAADLPNVWKFRKKRFQKFSTDAVPSSKIGILIRSWKSIKFQNVDISATIHDFLLILFSKVH